MQPYPYRHIRSVATAFSGKWTLWYALGLYAFISLLGRLYNRRQSRCCTSMATSHVIRSRAFGEREQVIVPLPVGVRLHVSAGGAVADGRCPRASRPPTGRTCSYAR